MRSLLSALLPDGARCAETFDDRTVAQLFPAEMAAVARSGAKRQQEYAAVRDCARQALAALGHSPVPLLRGPGGAPRWPDGTVGSLTHCAGFRGAAVAPSRLLASLGIDAEPARPLPRGVLGLVSSAEERAGLTARTRADPAVPWDRLLFCAKEAAYKAWFPLTGRWLGFHDAIVDVRPDGTFTARLPASAPGEPEGFAGRWRMVRGLLLAAVAVEVTARHDRA